jgi:L-alanine-DL-glutamate epimerase-like enolase superfamily enzyme
VLELEAPLATPWRIATATMTSMYATVVRVHTDEGLSGLGEAIVRLGPGATRAVVEEILAPVVLGRDPLDAEGIWDDMFATMRARGHSRGFLVEAMSGLDIALWDVAARKLGVPVYKLLGGHGRRRLPAYASSVLLDTPAEMARVAEKLAGDGFRAIKIKVGQNVRDDIARIEAVRAAVGPDIDLMLDANSGYDAPSAIVVAEAAEAQQVYWLEEPVPPDDLGGYRRIRAGTRTLRLAAGESEFTTAGFRPFLEGGILDVVQPDIARAGGFTGCRRIGALAHAYNVAYAPHTGASAAICIAASLHVAAAVPGLLTFEHMFLDNPLQQILTPPLPQPVGGVIEVPDRPGLGVDLDETVLSRFLVRRS